MLLAIVEGLDCRHLQLASALRQRAGHDTRSNDLPRRVADMLQRNSIDNALEFLIAQRSDAADMDTPSACSSCFS